VSKSKIAVGSGENGVLGTEVAANPIITAIVTNAIPINIMGFDKSL
jgi:hypothetical protein